MGRFSKLGDLRPGRSWAVPVPPGDPAGASTEVADPPVTGPPVTGPPVTGPPVTGRPIEPRDAEAGAPVGAGTSFRDRARLRRRVRYLRQTRELAFRDLGGFVFDARRFNRPSEAILEAKLKGLLAIDRELRALERALDEREELMLLHQPGISACPRCAAIQGSDANFCPSCGLPSRGAALPLGPRPPLAGPGTGTGPDAVDQPTAALPARSAAAE